MKCPFCHASEVEPDIVHPTLMTCLSCGSMWDPSDYAVDRDMIVDRVISRPPCCDTEAAATATVHIRRWTGCEEQNEGVSA